jgi:8-amino-7-oxononanoate synthase
MMGKLDYLKEELSELSRIGRRRFLRWIEDLKGVEAIIEGREVVLFCSNDYLGISRSERFKQVVLEVLERWGAGAPSSRSIAGSFLIHKELEEELSEFKGTERALLFSTGYMANLGILTSLVGEGDLILSDQFNHASIIDGARLSRAEIWVYRHRDMNHLEELLKRSGHRRRLIVSDGVFSMEGDIAPLKDLKELSDRYGAILVIDDAHGTGVLGKEGRGIAEHFGLLGQIDVQMGTLGKALGIMGAFVAGEAVLVEYLLNRARTFMYTTSLPPLIVGMVKEALRIMKEEPWRREKLWENTRLFREGAKRLGFKVLGETPIVPIVIGDDHLTMRLSAALFELGIYVQGIRPPTVPPGTSRLRFSISALHTKEHIEKALFALKEAGQRLGLI